MISSRELFLGSEQSWIDRFRPSPWIWSPERAFVAWIERSREQLRAMLPQAKEMQMDDRRAQSPSYRCDLTQTIRSGQTVDEVGATAIQDLMKRGVLFITRSNHDSLLEPKPSDSVATVHGGSVLRQLSAGLVRRLALITRSTMFARPGDREWMVNYGGWTRQTVATGRIFVPLTFFKEYTPG
jgi:hypothetical protein